MCNKLYTVRNGDLNRGYGRTCSRSCGGIKREYEKKGEPIEQPDDYRELDYDYYGEDI